MRAAPEYGAYVDEAPLEVLEQNNAMSLFGLHRRLRGAALGHLAAFEATSSMPSRRMAQGLQRLGLAEEMVDYYAEHVEADAVHEQLAVRDVCGALVEEEPELDDVSSARSPAWTWSPGSRAGCSARGAWRHDATASTPPTWCCAPVDRCCCAATTSSRTPRASRTHHPAGLRGLPVQQVGDDAVVRRHPQGAAGR